MPSEPAAGPRLVVPPSRLSAPLWAPRAAIVALVAFLLICCKDRTGLLDDRETASSSSARLPPVANFTADMTNTFPTGTSTTVESPYWEPLLCDSTSVRDEEGRPACNYYTAGRWKVPLLDRLAGSVTNTTAARASATKPSCAGNDILTRVQCQQVEHRTLRLVPTANCSIPRDNEELLRRVIGDRLAAKQPADERGYVSVSIVGNSVLRSLFQGLVRMTRGLPDGYDRGSHSGVYYVATTTGDFLFLQRPTAAAPLRAEVIAAAVATVGGRPLLHVENVFVCGSDAMAFGALRRWRNADHDIAMFFCNYTPESAAAYLHKLRLVKLQALLQGRLTAMNSSQSMVMFDSSEVRRRFTWNYFRVVTGGNLRLHNEYYRRFVARYDRERGAQWGRLIMAPLRQVSAACGVYPRDLIHSESIAVGHFPAPFTAVAGQPWGEHFPDLADVMWHVMHLSGM